MNVKSAARTRRAKKLRAKTSRLGKIRLVAHRSGQHMSAQVVSADGSQVLAQASTMEKAVREGLKSCSNVDAAAHVGKLVAERATKAGVKEVVFDRSGFQYHGRIKALAEAAREGGMEF